ncbi:hypothetical protein Tco_1546267 [Tanacetum coccineum]
MSNLPEEIVPGSVSQLAYNIASHLRGNGVNGLGPRVMFNGVEGFIPQANSEGVISGSVSEGITNDVMGNGGSVSVAEVVGNGLMVDENVMNNVNGLVSQVNVVTGGVMENGFVEEIANGVMENGVSRASVRALNNGVVGARSYSLGDVANCVMGNDVGRAGARVMNNGDAGVQSFSLGGATDGSIANGLRIVVHRRCQRIDRLEALRNCHEAVDTIRFWERMQLEDMEKGTRALHMMRETEAKIGEKARFILNLKGVVVD